VFAVTPATLLAWHQRPILHDAGSARGPAARAGLGDYGRR
jgi:hypothetical protein